jgi:ABC-type Fe3+/spermidine/putrescine transport system ATPase subunit
MADRIVVMDAGRIAQVGSPEEVYDRPASPFIASFMGAENTVHLDVRPELRGLTITHPTYRPPCLERHSTNGFCDRILSR